MPGNFRTFLSFKLQWVIGVMCLAVERSYNRPNCNWVSRFLGVLVKFRESMVFGVKSRCLGFERAFLLLNCNWVSGVLFLGVERLSNRPKCNWVKRAGPC